MFLDIADILFLFFSSMYIVTQMKEVCKILAVTVKFLNGNDEAQRTNTYKIFWKIYFKTEVIISLAHCAWNIGIDFIQ